MRSALTPSGLTIDRVRSSAIRFDLSENLKVREGPAVLKDRPRVSPEVYLGCGPCGNARGTGSAGLLRGFDAPIAGGSLDGKALPATAFALHVRVAEAEGLVKALLHEVNDGAIEQADAGGVHEHLHSTVLKHSIPRLRPVGVIDHIRETGTACLAHTESQTHALAARGQEALDAGGSGFRQ